MTGRLEADRIDVQSDQAKKLSLDGPTEHVVTPDISPASHIGPSSDLPLLVTEDSASAEKQKSPINPHLEQATSYFHVEHNDITGPHIGRKTQEAFLEPSRKHINPPKLFSERVVMESPPSLGPSEPVPRNLNKVDSIQNFTLPHGNADFSNEDSFVGEKSLREVGKVPGATSPNIENEWHFAPAKNSSRQGKEVGSATSSLIADRLKSSRVVEPEHTNPGLVLSLGSMDKNTINGFSVRDSGGATAAETQTTSLRDSFATIVPRNAKKEATVSDQLSLNGGKLRKKTGGYFSSALREGFDTNSSHTSTSEKSNSVDSSFIPVNKEYRKKSKETAEKYLTLQDRSGRWSRLDNTLDREKRSEISGDSSPRVHTVSAADDTPMVSITKSSGITRIEALGAVDSKPPTARPGSPTRLGGHASNIRRIVSDPTIIHRSTDNPLEEEQFSPQKVGYGIPNTHREAAKESHTEVQNISPKIDSIEHNHTDKRHEDGYNSTTTRSSGLMVPAAPLTGETYEVNQYIPLPRNPRFTQSITGSNLGKSFPPGVTNPKISDHFLIDSRQEYVRSETQSLSGSDPTNRFSSRVYDSYGKRDFMIETLKKMCRRDFITEDDLDYMFPGVECCITAFVIRGKHYHQIPYSGQFSLRKSHLSSQNSNWWRDFAFLRPDEIESLSQILADDEEVKTLIRLKWLRKDRMKFWSAKKRELVAIVNNESKPTPNETKAINMEDHETIRSPSKKAEVPAAEASINAKGVGDDVPFVLYEAFTIKVYELAYQPGNPTFKPIITREAFSETDILRRITSLNNEGPQCIDKKLNLLEAQQLEISKLLEKMCAKENSSGYTWKLAQLETSKTTSEVFRSVTVYLRKVSPWFPTAYEHTTKLEPEVAQAPVPLERPRVVTFDTKERKGIRQATHPKPAEVHTESEDDQQNWDTFLDMSSAEALRDNSKISRKAEQSSLHSQQKPLPSRQPMSEPRAYGNTDSGIPPVQQIPNILNQPYVTAPAPPNHGPSIASTGHAPPFFPSPPLGPRFVPRTKQSTHNSFKRPGPVAPEPSDFGMEYLSTETARLNQNKHKSSFKENRSSQRTGSSVRPEYFGGSMGRQSAYGASNPSHSANPSYSIYEPSSSYMPPPASSHYLPPPPRPDGPFYPYPARRESRPYPEYYDGRSFNPKAPVDEEDDDDEDIVRKLLLDWTPMGDELDERARKEVRAARDDSVDSNQRASSSIGAEIGSLSSDWVGKYSDEEAGE
jgi:hypothetical protein